MLNAATQDQTQARYGLCFGYGGGSVLVDLLLLQMKLWN